MKSAIAECALVLMVVAVWAEPALAQLAQFGGRFCDVSGRGVSRIKKLGSADS